MTEKEFSELAAAYSLGALSREEREAFERTLAEHPEWLSLVDEDRELVALLAETVPSVPVRPQVAQNLFAQLDQLIESGEPPSALRASSQTRESSNNFGHIAQAEAQSQSSSPQGLPAQESAAGVLGAREGESWHEDDELELARPSRRRRATTRLLAVVAIAALLVGVGSGLFSTLQPQQPPGILALEEVSAAPDAQRAVTTLAGGGKAALTWSAKEGRAVLVTAGLVSAPTGHTYELWYVRGDDKIPAGTFDPDERGSAAVLVSGQMHEGDTVAVTIEVTGGSPDGKPSDQLVFAIPTTNDSQPT